MEILKKILSELLYNIIGKLDFSKLYEIRLRNGQPITINYNNNIYFIGESGLTNQEDRALTADKEDISQIINNASNYSLYAINDQLKQGYISAYGGIRIGVVGEIVDENASIITVKNFNGINIRIPHEVKGCSLNILPYLFNQNEFLNTLIVSSPGAGKTTFLRDICYQISNHNMPFNILILDERNEIASCYDGKNTLNVGKFTDVITGGNKKVGFLNGIRSMSPDIICTDELGNIEDYNSINMAHTCGVKLLASIHASSVFELNYKQGFKEIMKDKIFKRFILLTNKPNKGTIVGVFDENLKMIYSG